MGGVFDKGEVTVFTQPTLVDGNQSALRIVLLMLPPRASQTHSHG
jgi:hypothetical protein